MTVAGSVAYVGALAAAAAIPGPGIATVVASVVDAGRRSSLAVVFGLILGDILYLTAVVTGLSAVAQSCEVCLRVLRWAGTAYLAFLAVRLWNGADEVGHDSECAVGRSRRWGFFSGLAVTIGNPATIVFYLALLPSIVDLLTVTPKDYAILVVLTVSVLAAVLAIYVVVAERARRTLAGVVAPKIVLRISAAIIAGTALAVAVR